MHFLQAINSDLSVFIVCNKTGGTIKGDIKNYNDELYSTKCKKKKASRYADCSSVLQFPTP